MQTHRAACVGEYWRGRSVCTDMGRYLSRSSGVLPAVLVAALSFLPGCFGTVGSGYVDVAYAPVNYAAYPSYVYDGANVYYIDGRWYRQDRGRWVYYRSEPPGLYRYRTSHAHVFVAPPARRAAPVYRAPPARREPARHYRAPPARREPARSHRAPPRESREYRAPPRERSRDDRRR
jgi:hypothetical protein